ncbi:DUF7004 family protein [Pseudoxanthomonas dokdonensis]|uniref:Uncharacterized protein n=1 Tax=Pseudoxanthomonas dokdonensis TaxID=344882 RepID=A0A0R0CL10_9GAMM|nr:hypothetical protein [Pseudoxanthomonas dokdonensis]KRG70607.1 hypothetical protein ABB29_06000 [Pseudoxanthomonas dokdonensis]
MPRHFKTLSDSTLIEFDRGMFDPWCVYVTPPGGRRFAPRDGWYFAELVRLGERHGHWRIYLDFVQVFMRTSDQLDAELNQDISRMAAAYAEDALLMDVLLTVLYAGMLAEENKARGPLGKRIKRLGLHQCLIEGMPAEAAAAYSRGRDATSLAAECSARGF